MDDLLTKARGVLAQQPFSRLLGAELTTASGSEVELRLPVTEQLKQQAGFVHGGVVSYLADNTLTFAAGMALKGNVVTIEIKVNYLRPAVGECLIARGRAISTGRTQAVARCDIFAVQDGVERLCAAALGTIGIARSAGGDSNKAP